MKQHCLIILFVFILAKISFGQCEQVLDGVFVRPEKVNQANIRSFNYRGENVFLIDTLLVHNQIVLPMTIQDGRYLAFYGNDTSRIAFDYEYTGAKPNGHAFRYYKSGQLSYQAEFKNGELNGKVSSYFSNGQLSYQRFYLNGELTGKYLVYYNDGQPKSETEYRNGNPVYLREWDCNGKLTYDHVYKDYYKH